MDDCGQPSAVQKLTSQVSLDRSRYNERFVKGSTTTNDMVQEESKDYFEFKENVDTDTQQQHQEWASQFKTLNNFPPAFEQAFSKLKATCPWAGEFAKQSWTSEFKSANNVNSASIRAESNAQWVNEFKASTINNASSWTDEFKNAPSKESVVDWVQEFTTEEGEDLELANTARDILNNLNYEHDPKLANSRFVSYLKDLAKDQNLHKTDNFQNWKQSFLQNVDHLVEDRQWENMNKTWEQYEGTGFGYKDFAKREFGKYHFSIPSSVNPYSQVTDKFAALNMERNNIRNSVLILEAMVAEDPTNLQSWIKVGTIQQANEMDAQSIAAFYQALQIDPNNLDALLGLAASCANESCIPDALEALQKSISILSGNEIEGNISPLEMAGMLEEMTMRSPSKHTLIAASVANNIAGRQDQAVKYLEQLTFLHPEDWSLQNRLGATLANSKRYNEAINIYKHLLNQGHQYPRVYYNLGIASMCLENYQDANISFIKAIESQQPVDVVTISNEELLPSYMAPWEALRVNLSLSGRDDLAERLPISISDLKSTLNIT